MIGHLALTHNLRLGTKNRIFDKIFKSVLNFVKIL